MIEPTGIDPKPTLPPKRYTDLAIFSYDGKAAPCSRKATGSGLADGDPGGLKQGEHDRISLRRVAMRRNIVLCAPGNA